MENKEFEVSGFVKNESNEAFFKLQRSLPPGGKIKFSDAFLTVGSKSGLEGKEFIKWLRENVFPGTNWGFYSEDDVAFFSETSKNNQDVAPSAPPVSLEAGRGAGRVERRALSKGETKKGFEITASSIIEAEFPIAKTLIEKCKSRAILKKALNLSQTFANKDEHMRHLVKRLEQV
jgi:hypothetical protein